MQKLHAAIDQDALEDGSLGYQSSSAKKLHNVPLHLRTAAHMLAGAFVQWHSIGGAFAVTPIFE